MLITCKSCAAVNFIQSKLIKRGEAHCTICKKLIDTTTPPDEDQRGFRISQNPTGMPIVDNDLTPLMPINAIREMLTDSVAKVPSAPMWGKNDDGHTSPDPLMLGELERKIESMNSKQRLALAMPYEDDTGSIVIEDEEEEEIDMTPSMKLAPMDMSRWNAATVPSIPAAKARYKLNQRLTLAAWLFVVGLGTAGVAGAAVSHATPKTGEGDKNPNAGAPAESPKAPQPEAKKPSAPPTATALLTNVQTTTPQKSSSR